MIFIALYSFFNIFELVWNLLWVLLRILCEVLSLISEFLAYVNDLFKSWRSYAQIAVLVSYRVTEQTTTDAASCFIQTLKTVWACFERKIINDVSGCLRGCLLTMPRRLGDGRIYARGEGQVRTALNKAGEKGSALRQA